MKTDSENLDSTILKYRKKHFKVKANPARYPLEAGEINLSVTFNGYQEGICLLQSEIPLVIEALKAAVTRK